MKVIIPAAGESRRLRPLTDKIPKTLLPVGDTTILRLIVESCLANGLTDFHILVGHGADEVKQFCETLQSELPHTSFDFIPVNEYSTKGNIWTVFQANHLFDEDVILVNSDTIVHPEIIKSLVASPEKHVLAVDDYKALGDEEMKVEVQDGRVTKIHKSLNPDTAHGEYIGALKISGGSRAHLVQAFEQMLLANPKLYYEDALQRAMDSGIRFGVVSTNGLPNMEIDTPEDLAAAQEVAKAIHQALWQ